MQLSSHVISLADVEADWLIVGVWEQEGLSGGLAELDAGAGGLLTRLLERGDLTGKARELTPILDKHGSRAKRVLAVGWGPRATIDFAGVVEAAAAAARSVTAKAHERVALAVPERVPNIDAAEVARAL